MDLPVISQPMLSHAQPVVKNRVIPAIYFFQNLFVYGNLFMRIHILPVRYIFFRTYMCMGTFSWQYTVNDTGSKLIMRISFKRCAKRYKGLLISLIITGCVYIVFLEGTVFSSVTGKLFLFITLKLRQWCSTISPISTKLTTSRIKLLELEI